MEILGMILDINDGDYWKEIWHKTPKEIQKTWDDTLRDVGECVTAYYKAIADRKKDPEGYLNLVLPQYWQIVRALNISRWGVGSLPSDSCYDVGIFSVGFSSLPIALSIAEIQPRQKIYFLHSDDTGEKCSEIIDRVEEMFKKPPPPFCPLINSTNAKDLITRVKNAKQRKIGDPSDPVSTFQEIKDIIDSVRGAWGNETRIALDLTGGKKTMIGGGFTAGSIYSIAPKCDMFYVDSLEYDSRRGTPKPGTEFLSRLENPYDVYNVQSVREAKKLFNKYNYEASGQLWEEVAEKLKTPVRGSKSPADRYNLVDEQEAVQKNLDMAKCYSFWDVFDYAEANRRKKHRQHSRCHLCDHNPCLINATHPIHTDDGYSWEYNRHRNGGIDVLSILSHMTDRSWLFDQPKRIIHFAVDRYRNGIRREKSGNLDDAIVRFTQVIEILCNYRIYQIAQDDGLVNHYPPYCTVDSTTITPRKRWDIIPLIRFLFGDTNRNGARFWYRDGEYSYDIKDSLLLNITDYGCENVAEITESIKHRHSWIHVNKSMRQSETQENAAKLRNFAKKLLKNFSRDYRLTTGLSFDDLLKLHEFRRLE